MKIRELYPDVITEDTSYEYKAVLNPDSPIKWAKTLIGYANDKGGTLFVGVSNDGEAFGIDLEEVDKTKLLISRINDRHIFPHIKISYMMRSVDSNAEHFVLAVKVAPADSVIRYREGDYNETVFIKGDGNATPATPEEIISLSKRKYGVDNETSEVAYTDNQWSEYLNLCKEYRQDKSAPTIKELQNEEIVSKDGYAKSLRKESKVVQTKKQYWDFSLTALSFASISIFSGWTKRVNSIWTFNSDTLFIIG